MLDDVQITNSHIIVCRFHGCGSEGTKIVVYDYDGNQLLKLGGRYQFSECGSDPLQVWRKQKMVLWQQMEICRKYNSGQKMERI